MTFGPFELEFVAVNHSIPDALAVAIRTGAGMVLHTGDFKMDQLPLDGRITDLRAFGRLGEEGVDLFLTDSTNAETPGLHAVGEVDHPGHRPGLPRLPAADHRRLLRLPRAPRPAGARRRGRPQAQGRLRRPLDGPQHGASPATSATSRCRPDVLVDAKELADLPPERQVLISTGSQGEPMSALTRIAQRNHNFVHIEEGDTVLLASSLIPGNENAVYRVINGLARWGANVVHKGNAHRARQRPRQRRRAPLLLQHRQAAQRAAGPRRDPAPAGQRRAGPGDRRRERRDRRGRRRRRPGRRRRRRSPARSTAATSSSTAPRSATSPSPTSRTAGSSARRASSR